jgi:hypothetical protein
MLYGAVAVSADARVGVWVCQAVFLLQMFKRALNATWL